LKRLCCGARGRTWPSRDLWGELLRPGPLLPVSAFGFPRRAEQSRPTCCPRIKCFLKCLIE
jgi:hypothetical protein